MSATTQNMAALAKANRNRLAAAEIKREIFEGRITAAAALYDERAQSLRIAQLLGAQRRWGPERARKFLEGLESPIPVRENRRVRELTERQRLLVAKTLDPWRP